MWAEAKKWGLCDQHGLRNEVPAPTRGPSLVSMGCPQRFLGPRVNRFLTMGHGVPGGIKDRNVLNLVLGSSNLFRGRGGAVKLTYKKQLMRT